MLRGSCTPRSMILALTSECTHLGPGWGPCRAVCGTSFREDLTPVDRRAHAKALVLGGWGGWGAPRLAAGLPSVHQALQVGPRTGSESRLARRIRASAACGAPETPILWQQSNDLRRMGLFWTVNSVLFNVCPYTNTTLA